MKNVFRSFVNYDILARIHIRSHNSATQSNMYILTTSRSYKTALPKTQQIHLADIFNNIQHPQCCTVRKSVGLMISLKRPFPNSLLRPTPDVTLRFLFNTTNVPFSVRLRQAQDRFSKTSTRIGSNNDKTPPGAPA